MIFLRNGNADDIKFYVLHIGIFDRSAGESKLRGRFCELQINGPTNFVVLLPF